MADVMTEVRAQHKGRRRQLQQQQDPGGGNVDRRTIERGLLKMQNALSLVTIVEAADPLQPPEAGMVQLVVRLVPETTGLSDFSGLINEYWVRRAAAAEAEKKRKRQAEDEEDEDDDSSAEPVKRSGTKRSSRPLSSSKKRLSAKRKAAASSDSETESDSDYSGAESDGSSPRGGAPSPSPSLSKALWRDDSAAGRSAEPTSPAPSCEEDNDLQAPETAPDPLTDIRARPNELQRSFRNKVIKQKKTFEDPDIFEAVAHPATRGTGWLVNCMRLHYELVQALLAVLLQAAESAESAASERGSFTMSALMLQLPIGFALSSSSHLRALIAAEMEQDPRKHHAASNGFICILIFYFPASIHFSGQSPVGELRRGCGEAQADHDCRAVLAGPAGPVREPVLAQHRGALRAGCHAGGAPLSGSGAARQHSAGSACYVFDGGSGFREGQRAAGRGPAHS